MAAALDDLTIISGCFVLIGSSAVALATWPSNHVLVSPTHLEHWAALVLVPSWAWLLISGFLFYGFRKKSDLRTWGPRPPSAAIAVLAVVALICAVTIAGGVVIGAAKGSSRIVAGQYQVSSGSLNNGEWTTVSPAAYRLWEAKFLRLDALFSLFGLVMIGVAAHFRWLKRNDPSPRRQP